MELTQSGMSVMPMEEGHKNSIFAGINIIEIRGYVGQYKSRTMLGFTNVSTKIDMSMGEPKPRVTWHTSNAATARLESGKNGIGVAYFPDDPWWTNRIRLIDKDKVLKVAALHTSQGVVPGGVIEAQIRALEERLREDVVRYRILENGIPKSDRDTREEAEDEIESFNMLQTSIDARTGQMKAVNLNKKRYTIIEIKHRAFRQEIKDLIKKYRNLEHGWTECAEFRKIQNELVAEFKNNKSEAISQEATPKSLAEILKEMAGMSKAEKAALLKTVLGDDEETEPEVKPKRTAKKAPEKVETVEA